MSSIQADFENWVASEEAAEAILPMVGRLYRNHGVVTLLNGISLVHQGPVGLIQAHRRGHTLNGADIDMQLTREALVALSEMNLAPVELDLGRLLAEYADVSGETSLQAFLNERCAHLARAEGAESRKARDIVLYGFGRIGRILARLLVAKAGGGDKYQLRAIVVRKKNEDDLERRASLLRRDSVHGPFEGTIVTLPEENALLVNGTKIKLLYANAPEEMDYTAHGIDDAVVIDNTGKWRDRDGLSRHLQAKGVSKVMLTAPGKGDVPNIVYGINDGDLGEGENVISAASCTTNAIVPVLKVLNDEYGVERGHIETIHAYTNDQNLIDNYHSKSRRGRAAALNMVITTTGAASAVGKALPVLKGKLTGSAIRVPTPNVSLAILNLRLGKAVEKDALNHFLREVATASPLRAQIGWTDMPDAVSSDMVGNSHASIVDAPATIVDDQDVVLYCWYDNEFGYSYQVMRLLEKVAGVERPVFP